MTNKPNITVDFYPIRRATNEFKKCRNILIAFSTTLLCENIVNTWGNDLRHSDNGKDWTICSQVPKCVIASIWERFRDYNGVGLKNLANSDDSLRYSPYLCESINSLSTRAA